MNADTSFETGYVVGLAAALRIVRRAEQAPQTRASEEAYRASRRRIARVLQREVEEADQGDPIAHLRKTLNRGRA